MDKDQMEAKATLDRARAEFMRTDLIDDSIWLREAAVEFIRECPEFFTDAPTDARILHAMRGHY